MNTLSDVKDMGRTRMLTHAASLASHLLNTRHDPLGLTELYDAYLEDSGSLHELQKTFINNRVLLAAKKIMSGAKSKVYENPNLDHDAKSKRIKELESEFMSKVLDPLSTIDHHHKLTTTSRTGSLKRYVVDDEVWNDLSDDLQNQNARKRAEASVKDTRKIATNEELLTSCVLADTVLRDQQKGHLHRTRQILNAVIEFLENGNLSTEDFADACDVWLQKILLVLDFKLPPAVLGVKFFHGLPNCCLESYRSTLGVS